MQIHPDFRTEALEETLLAAAEESLAEPDSVGKRQLTVWAHQQDELRQRLLLKRGYVRGDWSEYQRGAI